MVFHCHLKNLHIIFGCFSLVWMKSFHWKPISKLTSAFMVGLSSTSLFLAYFERNSSSGINSARVKAIWGIATPLVYGPDGHSFSGYPCNQYFSSNKRLVFACLCSLSSAMHRSEYKLGIAMSLKIWDQRTILITSEIRGILGPRSSLMKVWSRQSLWFLLVLHIVMVCRRYNLVTRKRIFGVKSRTADETIRTSVNKDVKMSPEEYIGYLSSMSFQWVTKVIVSGYKGTLTDERKDFNDS